jgi:PAS domain S-box-containing protein
MQSHAADTPSHDSHDRERMCAVYSAFKTNREAFVIIDRAGTIIDANEIFIGRHGKDRFRTGTNIYEAMADSDASQMLADRWKATVQRVFDTGKTCSVESHGDKQAIMYSMYPGLSSDGEVTGLFIVAQDITTQKHDERLWRDLRPQWDFMLDTLHLGAWSLNLDSGEISRSLEHDKLFGYATARQEWGNEEFLAHVVPEDRSKVRNLGQAIFRKPGNWSIEYRISRADGETRWIRDIGGCAHDENGRPSRLLGVSIDITEQKNAERRLGELEAQWDLTSSSFRLGLWKLDLATMHTMRNAEHARIFGSGPESRPWSLQEFLDTIVPEDRTEIEKLISNAIERKTDYRFQCRIRHPDGQIRWISAIAKIQFDQAGKATHIIGLTQDITEQKELKNEKKRQQDRLQQSQKLELIGQLAGGIAHDFNNVLAGIQGNAELLLGKIGNEQEYRPYLQSILNSVGRSAEMVMQLLAFARKQPWSPKLISPDDELRTMRLLLRKLIRKNIDLRMMPGCPDTLVNLDPANLVQIVTNLCVNARDAIDDNGIITIETALIDAPAYTRLAGAGMGAPDECIRLTVSDTGSGIDALSLPHIFEPFFTTKAVGKGSGLGLAMVYGLVKKNNGHISCLSEPGKGTTFTILFPVANAGPGLCHQPPEPEPMPELIDRRRLLLVEDEADILAIIRDILANAGFEVFVAGNAEEAVGLFEKLSGPIDLVITDIMLPGMNGVQMSRELRKKRPGQKFIFMSGYSSDAIGHYGVFEQGANFIAKPFRISDFLKIIHATLETDKSAGNRAIAFRPASGNPTGGPS